MRVAGSPGAGTQSGAVFAEKSGDFRISIVKTRAQFEALQQPWQSLFERSGRPQQFCQSFNWLWHWANCYPDAPMTFAVITGWQDERLVMVWPLVKVRTFGLTRLTWMGREVSPYGDALVEDGPNRDEWLLRGWKAVRSLGVDLVELGNVAADAAVSNLIGCLKFRLIATDAAPRIALANTKPGAPNSELSSKDLANIRRRKRRLAELGTIQLEDSNGGGLARAIAHDALALKHRWLIEEGVLSRSLTDSRFAQFIFETVDSSSHPVGGRASAITLNGQRIAAEISYQCRDYVFGHIIASSGDFKKYGLGTLIAAHALQIASDRDCKIFDLCPHVQKYKLEMASFVVAVHEWVFPLSWRGHLYVALSPWLVIGACKKAIYRLPLNIRRVLAKVYSEATSSRHSGRPIPQGRLARLLRPS